MYDSPNLGLTVWDLETDDFDHTQLEDNWLALDVHDHAVGHGVQIPTGGIEDEAITQAKIANNAVGNPQLQDNAVQSRNILAQNVQHQHLASGSVYGNVIPTAAIIASMLDPTIIPVGSIMLWWRPSNSNTTPGGFWEAMDGRPWSSITNYWNLSSGHIPDTRGMFVKGADLTGQNGPYLATAGGTASLSLAHTHWISEGFAVSVPAHTHSISADGSHYHTWMGGLHMGSRTNAFNMGIEVPTEFGGPVQNYHYSSYIQGIGNVPGWWDPPAGSQPLTGSFPGPQVQGTTDMDQAGYHNHGASTGYGGGATAYSSASAETTTSLGDEAVDPPWRSLLYIMRCR